MDSRAFEDETQRKPPASTYYPVSDASTPAAPVSPRYSTVCELLPNGQGLSEAPAMQNNPHCPQANPRAYLHCEYFNAAETGALTGAVRNKGVIRPASCVRSTTVVSVTSLAAAITWRGSQRTAKTMKFLSSSGVSKEKQLASTTYPAGRYVAECRTHCSR
jgi:hypothetical protein